MTTIPKTNTISHKKRRMIALKGWRRHVSGKEKWQANYLRRKV